MAVAHRRPIYGKLFGLRSMIVSKERVVRTELCAPSIQFPLEFEDTQRHEQSETVLFSGSRDTARDARNARRTPKVDRYTKKKIFEWNLHFESSSPHES